LISFFKYPVRFASTPVKIILTGVFFCNDINGQPVIPMNQSFFLKNCPDKKKMIG